MDTELAEVARRAFEWVGSLAVPVESGLAWLENGGPCDDLYSGTAGCVLAAAEAVTAGFDPLEWTAGAVGRLRHLADAGSSPTMPDDGLYTGWAGVPTALRAWSVATGDVEAADAAHRVSVEIAGRAARENPDCTDIISGDAGILLDLVAATTPVADAAASLIADRLVAAVEAGPDGPQWRMTSTWPSLMPGFSHGTAGVAYALLAAGRRLGRTDLVAVAAEAADQLIRLATSADGWALPLHLPPRPDRPAVNFGWCHGPAGTVSLFIALDDYDPEPRWRNAIDACFDALAASGLPERRYPGYWDNVARCCGTASVGVALLERYETTGERRFLDWTRRLAADVLARRITTPDGVAWSNTEHTRTPSDLPPEPGLMQGAAGIAGWLARLAACG